MKRVCAHPQTGYDMCAVFCCSVRVAPAVWIAQPARTARLKVSSTMVRRAEEDAWGGSLDVVHGNTPTYSASAAELPLTEHGKRRSRESRGRQAELW